MPQPNMGRSPDERRDPAARSELLFLSVEDTEVGVWQIRIFVEGMDVAIGTSLIAMTVDDGMRIADSMNARLGLDREAWTALAAKCAGAGAGGPN